MSLPESPVIRRLAEDFGYPVVDAENLDAFLERHRMSVLFFSGNPIRHPEANDVAVVLPELARAFAGRFQPAVVDLDAQETLQERFGFTTWPALVFMQGARRLGTITKMRDWNVYLDLTARMLSQTADATLGTPS